MTVELPKLQSTIPITEDDGKPSLAFHRWWQEFADKLKSELGGIETALTALTVAQEYMSDIPTVTIAADYTGTVYPAGQLPKVIACSRFNDTTDVTTSCTWSSSVRSGGITCSINAANGNLTVTAITSNSIVDITSVRTIGTTAVTLTKSVNINLDLAAAPIDGSSGGSGSGSGGTTNTDSAPGSITSTSMADITVELTVTPGSGGIVDLSAPLGVTTATSTASTYIVYGIWQWDSTGGGVWVDLGTEVQSSPNCRVRSVGGDAIVDDGALSVSYQKTGLPGTPQKFKLRARKAVGAVQMDFYGTAAAVGS